MYCVFMFNWQLFSGHYYKRSDAESVFSMVKEKSGNSLRSRSEEGQVNEVLAKVLCHNIRVRVSAAHILWASSRLLVQDRALDQDSLLDQLFGTKPS
jgi:hypothetical protein